MTDSNVNLSANLLTGLVHEWVEFTILGPNRLQSEQSANKKTKAIIGDSLPLSTNFNYCESREKKERRRICELLKQSIEKGKPNYFDAVSIAEKMEACLFNDYFYSVESIYYAKARILCENLSRNAVHLLTHYDAEILCYFPSDALASGTAIEEWRNNYKYLLEQKLLVQQIQRHGLFECHHCHSKNTGSYQSQTRSADEPATIFVNCFDCGTHFRR